MRAPVYALVVSLVGASPAAADQAPAERRMVAPLIRALTDCVASRVLESDEGPNSYRDGAIASLATRMVGRCQGQVEELVGVYDRVSGEGSGMNFLSGPYARDLPRAVLKRVGKQLAEKRGALDRAQAAEAARLSQEAADRAAREKIAEQENQTQLEKAKAAAAKAEAEAALAASQAAAAKQKRIDEAKAAESLLIDNAAACARKQLVGLVRSGESASVLATAVMTICHTEVGAMLDSSVEEEMIAHDLPSSAAGEGLLREKMKGDARDMITALAVQAKAGMGSFAPASN